jgi:hypothetical protein
MSASANRGGNPAMEWSALAFATALTAIGIMGVPRPLQDAFADVCHLAVVAGCVTIVLLFVTRLLGPKGIAIEVGWAALFLAAMPLVYVVSLLSAVVGSVRGLGVEIVGVPIYATLALLGLRRWPWLLPVGVAAHGLAWDSWHYLLPSESVPPWYAAACFLADVGLAVYFAARVPTWRTQGEFSWSRSRLARSGVR